MCYSAVKVRITIIRFIRPISLMVVDLHFYIENETLLVSYLKLIESYWTEDDQSRR